jgi:hypothetical protein
MDIFNGIKSYYNFIVNQCLIEKMLMRTTDNYKLYFIFIIVFVTLIVFPAWSHVPLRHHVIIALDCRVDDWIYKEEPRNLVLQLLNYPVNETEKGRHLYENGDYVSACTFGTNDTFKNVDKMTESFIHTFHPIGRYTQLTPHELRNRLTAQWDSFARSPNLSGETFSLPSLAKPFVLKSLNSETACVGRTFLILVSDKKPNGATLDDEVRAYMQKTHKKADGVNVDRYCDEVFNFCNEVMSKFHDRPIKSLSVRAGKPDYINPSGYVQLFEMMPTQSSFSVTSVISYPSRIIASRSLEDGYYIKLPLCWLNNPSYRMQQMEAFLLSADGDSLLSKRSLKSFSDTIVEWHIPKDCSPSHVQLKTWLRFYDGFYNATMMSPERNALVESGRDGLIANVDIVYESAADVLGLPMPTWLWKLFANIDNSFFNQHRAAFAAQIVVCTIVGAILLLLLILFARWLTKPRYYTPTHIEW